MDAHPPCARGVCVCVMRDHEPGELQPCRTHHLLDDTLAGRGGCVGISHRNPGERPSCLLGQPAAPQVAVRSRACWCALRLAVTRMSHTHGGVGVLCWCAATVPATVWRSRRRTQSTRRRCMPWCARSAPKHACWKAILATSTTSSRGCVVVLVVGLRLKRELTHGLATDDCRKYRWRKCLPLWKRSVAPSR